MNNTINPEQVRDIYSAMARDLPPASCDFRLLSVEDVLNLTPIMRGIASGNNTLHGMLVPMWGNDDETYLSVFATGPFFGSITLASTRWSDSGWDLSPLYQDSHSLGNSLYMYASDENRQFWEKSVDFFRNLFVRVSGRLERKYIVENCDQPSGSVFEESLALAAISIHISQREDEVVAAYLDHTSPFVSAKAAQALAWARRTEYIDRIFKLALDPGRSMKPAIFNAIAAMDSPAAVDCLRALEDAIPEYKCRVDDARRNRERNRFAWRGQGE